MILVQRAPAYATVQDLGRIGFRASGVPASGAMDRIALATLNVLVGNNRTDAGIEMALTGGAFVFDSASVFAVGGVEISATLNGTSIEAYRVYRANEGETLGIEKISGGRFAYLVVGGGIETPVVLSSRSTYSTGGFGGLHGRRLKSGDELPVGNRKSARKHQVMDSLPQTLRPPASTNEIRFILQPDVDAEEIAGDYRLSLSSDRTGYRLEGNSRPAGASVTSEPVCPGAIQLPRSGEPIVLMADAPTIGGYRVMGGVITADLGILGQKNPGDAIVLVPISVERAMRENDRLAEIGTLIEEWCLG
ncbi:MAG: biotin-dependent carboxyltransferase family protein [Gemmatimonadaceae bacterium]